MRPQNQARFPSQTGQPAPDPDAVQFRSITLHHPCEAQTLLIAGRPFAITIPKSLHKSANGLPVCIVHLDPSGVIRSVDQYPWHTSSNNEKFGLHRWDEPDFLRGCRSLASMGDTLALRAADGIESVLNGVADSFSLRHDNTSDNNNLAFSLFVIPTRPPDEEGAVLIYFEPTDTSASTLLQEPGGVSPTTLMWLHSVNALGADLAHRLSQPLTAITYYCEILQYATRNLADTTAAQTSEGSPLRYIEQIVRQTRRATHILDDVRSRVRAVVRTDGRVEIPRLLKQVIEHLLPRFAERQIGLEVCCQQQLPVIGGDPLQLAQALVNIIVNSIEALSSDGNSHASVQVCACQSEEGIHITVADTGPGVPADRVQSAFELFQTSKPDHLGFGLGLSRSIIRAHGGRMWYQDDADGGAVFQFVLPIDEDMP